MGSLAAAVCDVGQDVRFEPDESEPGAVTGQPLGQRRADAAGCAGDEDPPAAQAREICGCHARTICATARSHNHLPPAPSRGTDTAPRGPGSGVRAPQDHAATAPIVDRAPGVAILRAESGDEDPSPGIEATSVEGELGLDETDRSGALVWRANRA